MKLATLLLVCLLSMLVGSLAAQSSAWDYSTKTSSIDGRVTETALSWGEGDNEPKLVVRCSKSCEMYMTVHLTIVEEQSSVRVKFNTGPVKRFAVSRGEGSDSLFFRDPMGMLKAMRDNGGYMTVEYSPFEKLSTEAKFGVWSLPPTILTRVEKWETQSKVIAAQEKVKAQALDDQHRAFCAKLQKSCQDDGEKTSNCIAWHVQCSE